VAGLAIEEFVKPFYMKKDSMHDLWHVKRVLKIAEELRRKHKGDSTILLYGAYLHGVVKEHGKKVETFLKSQKFPEKTVSRMIKAAKESSSEKARTLEGRILHDAHLLEGGESYLVVKTITTGTERGQNMKESLKYLEENVLGKRKCYFFDCQKEYDKKEKFARDALKKLKMTF
jgi:uncharacterized protein